MSDITDVLTEVVNIKRETSFLLNEVAIAASLSADRQPPKSCRLEVTIAGATVSSGLVNIAGNVNESFTFSENEAQVGVQNFTSISGITISGLEGGTVNIRAVSKMGGNLNQEYLVAENMAVRFYARSGRIRAIKTGDQEIAEYKIMAEPDADILVKDQLYAVSGISGLTLGEILFVKGIKSFAGVTHHLEAEVKLR